MMPSMRTTVTLDPDVAAKLKALPRYTQPMGLRPAVNLDKAVQLASALEDEEILRKLEVRQ